MSIEDVDTGAAAHETHLSRPRSFRWAPSEWETEYPVIVNATSTLLVKRSEKIYHAVTSADDVYGQSLNSISQSISQVR